LGKINGKYLLKHKHLIAGDWVGGDATFTNEPVSGEADSFAVGTLELINKAAKAAEDAFWSYGYSSGAECATFLRSIAEEIEVRADAIVAHNKPRHLRNWKNIDLVANITKPKHSRH
jgi:acyl-CoA reductase-like NAD-dependent aldehyde dehydrogenase